MQKLSIGNLDSTLGNHLKLALALFGEKSGAVAYLREQIASDPKGEDGEVIADESQVVYMLRHLHEYGYKP